MHESIISRYNDRLSGVLSCYVPAQFLAPAMPLE